MRTAILVIFTVFGLTLGFWAYKMIQMPRPAAPTDSESKNRKGDGKTPSNRVATPSRAQSDTAFGTGDMVWYEKYDKRSGRLSSRLRARQYKPRADGWVDVVEPLAQFFMADGRMVSIEGASGEVLVNESGGKSGLKAFQGNRDMPGRGHLRDVVIKLYHGVNGPDDVDNPVPPKMPALTVTLDNASYSNEKFEIYSERYRNPESNRWVPADQVPVVMRGADYDFNGRGLHISWNDRDERLQSLDIAHGEQLVIKHPSKSLKGAGTRPATQAALDEFSPLPFLLADKGKKATGEAINTAATGPSTRTRGPIPKPPKRVNLDPPLYQAIFSEDVVIVQGNALKTASDRLVVDFLMQDQEDEPSSATRPSTRRASDGSTRRARSNPATTQTAPASRRAGKRPAEATRDEADIVIQWKGPLSVRPPRAVIEGQVIPGQYVIRLDGSRVVAMQNQATVTCGVLTYRTADDSVTVLPMKDRPVELKDARGSIVHTQSVDFWQSKREAVLRGASRARFVQESAPGKPADPLNAAWTDTCTLRFAESSAPGEMNIDKATLVGNVDVDHPQLKLKSQKLAMDFDPSPKATARPATQAAGPVVRPATAPATGPTTALAPKPASTKPAQQQFNLRSLVATGSVWCRIEDKDKKPQVIESNVLELQTMPGPDGHFYPSTVVASGEVHAAEPDQDLRADHLAMTLRPATRPTTRPATGPATAPTSSLAAVELQSLIAHSNVRVTTKDGAQASGDQLLVNNRDGKNVVRLLGQPTATIINKDNTLAGPMIVFDQSSDKMNVVGAGAMEGKDTPRPGQQPRPLVVKFDDGMLADLRNNVINLHGNVEAKKIDDDGTVNTANGKHVDMVLADKPATRPATKPATALATLPATLPATTGPASTRPSSRPSAAYTAMASREVRQITFRENAQVSMESLATNGDLLRRIHIGSDVITADLVDQQFRRLVIPVKGQMAVEDHRPPAKPAGKQADAPPKADGQPQDRRGSTAFRWSERFVYDSVTRVAVMDGTSAQPVQIAHRPDQTPDRIYRLSGRHVTAEMDEAPPAAGQPGNKPGVAPKPPAAAEVRLQLRRITATGALVFTAPGATIYAHDMEYDPRTQILIARGDGNAPVTFEIATKPGQQEATFIKYNVQTGELLEAQNVRVNMRPGQ